MGAGVGTGVEVAGIGVGACVGVGGGVSVGVGVAVGSEVGGGAGVAAAVAAAVSVAVGIGVGSELLLQAVRTTTMNRAPRSASNSSDAYRDCLISVFGAMISPASDIERACRPPSLSIHQPHRGDDL